MLNRLPPGLSALIEVGILFIPAIPAYLWIWPNIQGSSETTFQILVYFYVLAGTIFIGRRRWSWGQLGINRRGIWLGLGCTLIIIIARLLIILGFAWNFSPPLFNLARLAWNTLYYFALVGLVEELLFRGLIFRALEDWRGKAPERHASAWAIWGSSFGFMLWHIFGQGPLAGISTLIIGLAFALIRWRGGGILGLIILHGFWDLESTLLIAAVDLTAIYSQDHPVVASPWLVILGTVLLFATPLYVWLAHPWVCRFLVGTPHKKTSV